MATASPGQIDVPNTTRWWVGFIDTRRGSPNGRYVNRTLLIGKQQRQQRSDYLSLITRWHRQEPPLPSIGLLHHLRRTHAVRFGYANDFFKDMAQPRLAPAAPVSPGPTGHTWPHWKLRRKVPCVDGALTT